MCNGISSIVTKVVVAAVLAGSVAGAAGQSPSPIRKVLREKSPAFVTLKYIMKVKAGAKQSEVQDECTGAMIDPKGLILCSNTRLGGLGAYYRSVGRDVTTTPTEIKVLIGEDTEGLDARVVARDTELDLVWVQIKDVGDRKFAFIDLADSREADIGDPVIIIRRMSKLFDRAAVIAETTIAGVTAKPRKLYVPVLPVAAEFGLPVFSPGGKVLGVPVLHGLNDRDQDESDRYSRAADMQELRSGLILPAADVLEATRRARQTAATQPEPDATQPAASQPAEE